MWSCPDVWAMTHKVTEPWHRLRFWSGRGCFAASCSNATLRCIGGLDWCIAGWDLDLNPFFLRANGKPPLGTKIHPSKPIQATSWEADALDLKGTDQLFPFQPASFPRAWPSAADPEFSPWQILLTLACLVLRACFSFLGGRFKGEAKRKLFACEV